MAQKQTAVRVDRDKAGLNTTGYIVTVAGKDEPRIEATRYFDPNTQQFSITILSPLSDGKPVFADSTLDAVARRINNRATVNLNCNKRGRAGNYQRKYKTSN